MLAELIEQQHLARDALSTLSDALQLAPSETDAYSSA
jgi:hypothetical protein